VEPAPSTSADEASSATSFEFIGQSSKDLANECFGWFKSC
jgi:hypothetical protein